MINSFWADGPEAYEDGLRIDYEARLCGHSSERELIETEIQITKQEFKIKRRGIRWLLF